MHAVENLLVGSVIQRHELQLRKAVQLVYECKIVVVALLRVQSSCD